MGKEAASVLKIYFDEFQIGFRKMIELFYLTYIKFCPVNRDLFKTFSPSGSGLLNMPSFSLILNNDV